MTGFDGQTPGASAADLSHEAPRPPAVGGGVPGTAGPSPEELATGPGLLGARVRALRLSLKLSLRDLAERSGVSAPMLSQVERGETSPTLAVAAKIAAGLELRLSQLLRLDEASPVSVVRAAERRTGPGLSPGHAYEILTPPLPGQRFELSEHTLAPGASTGGPDDPPMHAAGSRETALVSAGTVSFACDGDRFELAPGDAVTFDADLPHHFENRGADVATLYAVVSAGLARH